MFHFLPKKLKTGSIEVLTRLRTGCKQGTNVLLTRVVEVATLCGMY